jgi:hypothetical protein
VAISGSARYHCMDFPLSDYRLETAVSYGLLSGFVKIRRVNSQSVHLPNRFSIFNHIQQASRRGRSHPNSHPPTRVPSHKMFRLFARLKSDASMPTSLQKMRNQSIRLPDDHPKQIFHCQTIDVQSQEEPTPMPKWKMLFVQAFISMGQTANPFLLSTVFTY